MCATTTTAAKIHPFEARGLGRAPFRCVGSYEDRGPHYLADGSQIGAPGQPMGSCDYCGQGIAHCFQIQSADGKTFVVGSDCVAKTNREAATTAEQRALVNQVNNVVKAHKRAQRHANEAKKMEEARAWFDANRAALEALPNPYREGESRWQQVEWYRNHAGVKGNLDLYRAAKKWLGETC